MRLLPLPELSNRDIDAWRTLAFESVQPNPFHEPDYVLPLARRLGLADDVWLAVISRQSRWIACLPVCSRFGWHKVPVPAITTWRGHSLYSLLGTPLVAGDVCHAAIEEFLWGLLSRPGRFVAGLDWIEAGGPVEEAIIGFTKRSNVRSTVFDHFQRALLTRHASDDYAQTALGSKRLKELRRQRRKLGESLDGDVVLHVDEDGSYLVDELIRLEASTSLAERGTVLAADPTHAAFFKEMCEGFAREGRLRALSLQVGDRVVAALCDIRAGDGIFGIKTAYDGELHRYSPGTQLEVEAMSHFHNHETAAWIDSCADPQNSAINRLWTERRTIMSIGVAGGGKRWVAGPAMAVTAATRARLLQSGRGS